MNDFVIIWTDETGKLSILVPVLKEKIEADLGREVSDEEYAQLLLKDVPVHPDETMIVSKLELPSTREFRNAWTKGELTKPVKIDVEKARGIVLEELRAKRQPLLDQADKEVTRAYELNKLSYRASLLAHKQELRDLTEPLKALDVEGKFDDEGLLETIRAERNKAIPTLPEES